MPATGGVPDGGVPVAGVPVDGDSAWGDCPLAGALEDPPEQLTRNGARQTMTRDFLHRDLMDLWIMGAHGFDWKSKLGNNTARER
ncbi:hypothetical protein [Janthinobacterium sp. 17J80-10]|uniref:hypothetical protein n=1 Tax=Janthinobacterium sp. 17J80-10 TaxID=2497863 RepID=UPI0013E8E435|nr:hypothetical protein [Janthinobacterium sp. 17J80-10]